MTDLSPRIPRRPLIWSETILNLQEQVLDFETPVYIIGGAVRDAYLHRPIKDLDLATPESAIRLARMLANVLNADVFVLDEERDVARVLFDTTEGKLLIDVAAFRAETLLQDLQDRDFTMNAMAVDFRGDLNLLIDPLNGEADIAARQLRHCAPQAMQKDVIRALRAVRQSVQFGFRIEAETLAEVRSNAPRLKETSGERIRDEFVKLLHLPKPAAALRVADKVGLLTAIVPELATLHSTSVEGSHLPDAWEHTLLVIDKLTTMLSTMSFARTDATAATFHMGMIVMAFARFRSQLNQHMETTWAGDRPHVPLLVLAALLLQVRESDDAAAAGTTAGRVADELRLSSSEKQRLVLMIRHTQHPVFQDAVTPLAAHRFWYPLREAGIDALFLTLANILGTKAHLLNQKEWLVLVERARVLLEAYYERYDEIVVPPLLVDGNQLQQQLKIKAGPQIGELLTLIREGQAAGSISSQAEALDAARAHLRE